MKNLWMYGLLIVAIIVMFMLYKKFKNKPCTCKDNTTVTQPTIVTVGENLPPQVIESEEITIAVEGMG